MNATIINFVQRKRLTAVTLVIAFAVGFLVAGPAPVADAAGPMGAYEIVVTPAAAARTALGECSDLPIPSICGETCLITMEGVIIPQGIFHCIPI